MSDHHHHARSANKKVLAVSLGLIASFMLIEAAAGWLTNSLALLSDAGHMFSDAAAIALSLAAFRMGERPADSKRSFGYQRFEIIAAALNGFALLLLALWIAAEAAGRLLDPPEIAAAPMLAVATAGLAVNAVVARYMLKNADTEGNINIRTAYLHVLGDLLGSLGAVAAGILVWAFGWAWADPAVSLLIALLIGKSGWGIIRSSLHILMEGTPAGTDIAAIEAGIRSIGGILDVHDIHAWTITSHRHALSCHIVIDGGLTVAEAYRISREVEAAVQAHGIIHVTVQTEPPHHGHAKQSCAMQHGGAHHRHGHDETPGEH